MKIKDYSALYFLCALFFIVWVVFEMFQPYWNAIFMAAVFSGAFYPLKQRLIKKYRMPPSVSVWTVTATMMIILIVPSIYILTALTQGVGNFVLALKKYELNRILTSVFDATGNIYLPEVITKNFNITSKQIDFTAETIQNFSKEAASFIVNRANSLLSDTLFFMVQFFIFSVSVYIFLKNGREIKRFILSFIPLSKKNSLTLISQIDRLNFLTIVGNGVGGVIQGNFAAVVFLIAGADDVILWGVIMAMLAFIPLIGISIIYIPYTIVLLVDDRYLTALFVFVSCASISFIVENIYKPIFIGHRMNFNSVLLLFGIIGGLSLFGVSGIFYGPLIVLTCLFMLNITRRTFNAEFDQSSLKEIMYAKNNSKPLLPSLPPLKKKFSLFKIKSDTNKGLD